jgi:hypothetical protein
VFPTSTCRAFVLRHVLGKATLDLRLIAAPPSIGFIATEGTDHGTKTDGRFRACAVRIALTSGVTRKQVADDPGVGMSTLNTWITAHRNTRFDVESRS